MKGDSLLMSLILAGGAAYVVYLLVTNQIGPVVAAGSTGQVPVSSPFVGPQLNCPGDPACPGTAAGVTPVNVNAPLTVTWDSSAGIS